jgi:hypothetical protein
MTPCTALVGDERDAAVAAPADFVCARLRRGEKRSGASVGAHHRPALLDQVGLMKFRERHGLNFRRRGFGQAPTPGQFKLAALLAHNVDAAARHAELLGQLTPERGEHFREFERAADGSRDRAERGEFASAPAQLLFGALPRPGLLAKQFAHAPQVRRALLPERVQVVITARAAGRAAACVGCFLA